jgi:hypothetical protein
MRARPAFQSSLQTWPANFLLLMFHLLIPIFFSIPGSVSSA